MDALPVLVFVIIILVFVAVVVLESQARKKRIADMQALATRLGYEYAQDAGMLGALDQIGLLSRGHSHKTTNLLRAKEDGTTTAVFDWYFAVGHGKHRTSHNQSVLLFESPRLSLPAFKLRPEHLGHRIAGLLGQQDIDFEGQPDFSSAYLLQGSDEPRIRAFFDRARLTFLAARPGLCLDGNGSILLYYRADRRLSPDAIPALVEEGRQVFHLLTGEAPPAAREPDPLAGLDQVLAEMGITEGEA